MWDLKTGIMAGGNSVLSSQN